MFNRPKRYAPIRKGRHRKVRPKSFKTEVAAHTYAKNHGITAFTLKNLKNVESKEKKLVIVPK